MHTQSITRHTCYFCEEVLTGFRYDCQDCPNHYCSACRILHNKLHTLKSMEDVSDRSVRRGEDACNQSPQETLHETIHTAGDFKHDGEGHVHAGDEEQDHIRHPGDPHDAVSDIENESEVGQSNKEDSHDDNSASNDKLKGDPDENNVDGEYLPSDKAYRQLIRRAMPTHNQEFLSAATTAISEAVNKAVRTAVAKALGEVTSKINRSETYAGIRHGSTQFASRQPGTPFSLIDFDVDLAGVDPEPQRPKRARTRTNKGHGRPWMPEDRRRLSRLKNKGWDDAGIGQKMNRTVSAVV